MRVQKAIALLLFFSVFLPNGRSQEVVHKFSEPFNYAASDPIGNFYLVKEYQLRKIDTLSNTLYTFSNSGLGIISSLDTSDPFRILLYYKSFNQVLFLDRTLSPIGDPIKLDQLAIFDISGICRAKQGGFWLINSSDNSLVYLDNQLNIKTSIHLSSLDHESEDQWYPMLEWKESLFICFPEKKILKFDLFGTLLKSIPIKASYIQSRDNNLMLSGDEGLYIFKDSPYKISGPLSLNLPDWEQLVISGDFALIKRDTEWILFRIKKTLELPH